MRTELVRRSRRVASLAAAAALLCGCAPARQAGLHIGLQHRPCDDVLVIARDLGFFRAEGVEVELWAPRSGSDARKAWSDGRIEVMTANPIELALARAGAARRAQAFYVLDSSDGAGTPASPSQESLVELLVADSSYVCAHAGALTRVVRACERARLWAQAHPDSAAERMAAIEHVPPATAAALCGDIRMVRLAEQWSWLGRNGSLPALLERTRTNLESMGRQVARDTTIDMVTARALPPELSP